jgi:hypothetical protein
METMTYKEKLTLLFGRPPLEAGIEYNMKLFKFKSLEESAKDLFEGTIILPKFKKRAKKLGLI